MVMLLTVDELPLIVELRTAIRSAGVSLREVARGSKVSQPQLSNFLGGKTLTLISAAKLFEYFEFKVQKPERQPSAEVPPNPEPEPPPAPSTARKTKKPAWKSI